MSEPLAKRGRLMPSMQVGWWVPEAEAEPQPAMFEFDPPARYVLCAHCDWELDRIAIGRCPSCDAEHIMINDGPHDDGAPIHTFDPPQLVECECGGVSRIDPVLMVDAEPPS